MADNAKEIRNDWKWRKASFHTCSQFKCKMPTLVKFIESTQSVRHMKHKILPVDVTHHNANPISLQCLSKRISIRMPFVAIFCAIASFFFVFVRGKLSFRFHFVSAKLMHKFWITALRTSDFYFVSYFPIRRVRVIISIFHSALYFSAMKLNLIDAKVTKKDIESEMYCINIK